MSIKRFYASKDTTITDAYKAGLTTRATKSNTGESDVLEVFSIYGQASDNSVEKSRLLIQFSMDDIISARADGTLPAAGAVNFKLKIFNAVHAETVPKSYTLESYVITKDWTEGLGLDMEGYTDEDACSWDNATSSETWAQPGGDFDLINFKKTQSFSTGLEDLEIDVTDLVESWIDGTTDNYGMLIKLSDSLEDGSLKRSYYTKRFFARGTEFFYKQPTIEAQWDASTTPADPLPDDYKQKNEYVFNITNLKSEYKNYEKTKLYVYTRGKQWEPNIYTKANYSAPVDIVDEAYYRVIRVADGLEVIPYSYDQQTNFTKMSYDTTGSHFDLDMSLFETNHLYEISFVRKSGNIIVEQEEKFRFRVD